jgi:lambda repressor-like predicted transcriptional regulator
MGVSRILFDKGQSDAVRYQGMGQTTAAPLQKLARGMSLYRLETRAGIGHGTLSLIVRGKRKVTLEVAEKLARAVGVSRESLLETLRPPAKKGRKHHAPKS